MQKNNFMQKIIQVPTSNFNSRGNYKPELVVIHIMDGSLAGTDSWFQKGSAAAGRPVSAHYGIGKNGEIHQYVDEKNAAWHAGNVQKPSFKLYKQGVNPNAYTIGIEHEGMPLKDDVWPAAMKQSSAELLADICKRNNIPLDRDHVIGHYQVYAGKPNCPALNKGVIDEIIAMAQKINAGTAPAPAAIRLIEDNGTVYMVAGVKDVRVVGIVSPEVKTAMFGDAPVEKGTIAGLPKPKTLGVISGLIVN